MARFVFVKGKDGRPIARLPSGKIVLPARGFNPRIGEEWECEVVEKDRFALAHPLRRVEEEKVEGEHLCVYSGEVLLSKERLPWKWVWRKEGDCLLLCIQYLHPRTGEVVQEVMQTSFQPLQRPEEFVSYISRVAVPLPEEFQPLLREAKKLLEEKRREEEEVREFVSRVFSSSERLREFLASLRPPELPPRIEVTQLRELEKEAKELEERKRSFVPSCRLCGEKGVKVRYWRDLCKFEVVDSGKIIDSFRKRSFFLHRGGWEDEERWICPTPGCEGDLNVDELEKIKKREKEIDKLICEKWVIQSERDEERTRVAREWFDSLLLSHRAVIIALSNNCPLHEVRGKPCPDLEIWDGLCQTHRSLIETARAHFDPVFAVELVKSKTA